MAVFAKDIRNIALIGHAGEGKTTLAEAMLVTGKTISEQGNIEKGNTVMDFDPVETLRKISINLSIANCNFHDVKFNIIDVPGDFDFEGEMVQALSVAGGAVIVAGATGTLTVGTEKALDYCISHKIPTIIFINGVDKENANYGHTVDAIREKYPKVASIIVPEFEGPKMVGYVSTIDGKYSKFGTQGASAGQIPANLQSDYEAYHANATEIAAGANEELMTKFFDTMELSVEEIVLGLKQGLANGELIPVVGGSASSNKGVHHLMQVIIDLMPSPADRVVFGKDATDNKVEFHHDSNGQVVLQVFKTITDQFVGKLSYFKVLSGTVKSGMVLHNAQLDHQEKINNLYFVNGKKQIPTDEIVAGDIGATAKLEVTRTGDTLCASQDVFMPQLELPSPVYMRAIYPAKKDDKNASSKIADGVKEINKEDISFVFVQDKETNEMIIQGVGDTQLDVICKKLKNKYNVDAVLQVPRIAYRETIKGKSDAEGKHKKQSGGAGQFGVCNVRFEPGAADGEFEFCNEVVGGAIPTNFIPAVEKGLREAAHKGVLAGYPMVNLKCTVYDGKYHPVDSKEIAFITAGKLAYDAGIPQANPVLLEPVYELQIIVPDDYLGDVMGDMNKRRGRIIGTEMEDGKQIVTAEAPLSEISRYSTDLRSMTQGRGKYSIKFARYEEVPSANVAKIVEEAKKLAEEE